MKKHQISYKNILFLACMVIMFVPGHSQSTQKIWQWANQLGGFGADYCSGITSDSKNNIYVAGSFTRTMEVDDKKIHSAGSKDMYLAKYNKQGKLKWVWNAGGENLDQVTCLKAGKNKEIHIAGSVSDGATLGKTSISASPLKLFFASINQYGKCSRKTELSYSNAASLTLLETLPNGEILLAGSFKDSLQGGDKKVISSGGWDIFIAKVAASGKFIDLVKIGGKGNESITTLSADSRANIYLSGNFESDFIFDGHQFLSATQKATGNVYMLKTNSDFKKLWSKTFHSDNFARITSLKTDSKDNVLLCGSFKPDLHLDDRALYAEGMSDIFVSSYSPDGKTRWVKQYGSSYMDLCYHLMVDKLDGAIINGAFSQSIQLDSLLLESENISLEAFVGQLSAEGNMFWAENVSGNDHNLANGATLDRDGNLYMAGSFRGKMETGASTLEAKGGKDIYLAKFHNCDVEGSFIETSGALCPGGETTLSVNRAFHSITWNTRDNASAINITLPGTYWVRMTDKKACELYDTLVVEFAQPDSLDLGEDTVLNVNEKLSLEVSDAYEQVLWEDGSVENTHLVQAPNKQVGSFDYWVSVVDTLGCENTDTIAVAFVKAGTKSAWENASENGDVQVYPNPVRDWLEWELNTEMKGKFTIELTSSSGQRMYKETIRHYLPGEKRKINMQQMPPALYHLVIYNRHKSISVKVTHI